MDPSYPPNPNLNQNPTQYPCPYPYPYPPPPQSADPSQQRAPYLQSHNSFPSQPPHPHPDPQFNPNAAYPHPHPNPNYPPSYYNPNPNYYNPYANPIPNPYPYPHQQAPYSGPNPNPLPQNYNPADHLDRVQISDHHQQSSAPSSPHAPPPHLYLTPSHSFSSSHHGSAPLSPGTHNLQVLPFAANPPPSNTNAVPYSGGGHQKTSSMQMVPYGAGPGSMQMAPYGGGGGAGQQSGSNRGSLKVLLLHGSLDFWVCEARYLPNFDMFSKRVGDMFGKRLSSMGKLDGLSAMTSDPYVSIVVGGAVVGRTYVVPNNEHPVWMQHFNVPVAHYAAEVEFLVKDSDIVGSQLIGSVMIPAEWIYSGERVEGIFPILGSSGKPCKPGATLRISMLYIPILRLSMYHLGVGAGPEYIGVPGTYFPLRKGGRVTLYQDAHVPDGLLPDLTLEGGHHYVHGQCWLDILEAISQARRLIYITGWSVFHTIRLVRGVGTGKDITLGELLKAKSQEGVRVLLLIWDDPTSRSILGYKMNGIMDTHDEETRRFFKNSTVQVLLCPRSAGKKHSWIKQQETGVIFTHHQKTVVLDADAGNFKRKIIAFVGGLDLCGGRYDTPRHPLFRTLQTLHKDDFHQPNFTVPVVNGPREPWHDLHTRIDGPAAYDVLTNFEERWLKAAKRHGIKKIKKSYDDALLNISRVPEILGIHESPYINDTDPETWHVQIFRSIDSNSVKGFPKDPKIATSKNLVCGKNVLIDMSIHTAYVKAIRAAQHFLYIENQYFLGSSYNWDSNKDLGANNLIPIEIALKIANKIKANERFSAYIIVPMWPEGNPTGAATQRILYWQKKTMQMMYETIYKALKEEGLEETYEPQDYLNFFCLGNREVSDQEDAQTGSPTAPATSPLELAKKNRRFMIYVHSKGMIVDDEYLIVGSANINQRSLEGTRDTEIAMGAYQPEHTWARKIYGPRGQIFAYRMSLWAEHIGHLEECYTQPESLECMRRIRHLGELNWKQFAAEDVTDMNGHLMKYPVDVDKKGKVKPLAGCESFPDLGGNICGSFLGIQENLTI